ncbi:thymidylate synthase [Pseudochelatococcus sp. G4_1912]|uniref:thymidylate synthase n=1 Tax=Pseudochelatococcus sp. G4_1912 TaxID=3114288 RepID=UPI0039C6A158
MEIVKEGIDDILIELYQALIEHGKVSSGTRGEIKEILGVLVTIRNPCARISCSENRGKPFSALGELIWYLSGSNRLDFIQAYIDKYKDDAEKNGTLHGAYGPRLYKMRGKINQLKNVINLLKRHPDSKRAVIQIFNAEDITGNFKEIPCTTTMQFFVRQKRLYLSITMRSNDAYWGLPHDVFCFTMMQEIVARQLGYELGEYYHYVGSMHIYTKYIDQIQSYINEGWQRTSIMPSMPPVDPWPKIKKLIKAEAGVRNGKSMQADNEMKAAYWADLLRLVQVFWASGNDELLNKLKPEFKNKDYRTYLETRRHMKQRLDDNSG